MSNSVVVWSKKTLPIDPLQV